MVLDLRDFTTINIIESKIERNMDRKITEERKLIYRGLDFLRTVLILDLSLIKDRKIKSVLEKEIATVEKLMRKYNGKK